MHVVLQSQQTGGESRQRAADRRCDKIDLSLVDAHQTDDVAVLRDRANGCSDKGPLEK
jgi:hypothetical protein